MEESLPPGADPLDARLRTGDHEPHPMALAIGRLEESLVKGADASRCFLPGIRKMERLYRTERQSHRGFQFQRRNKRPAGVVMKSKSAVPSFMRCAIDMTIVECPIE